MGGEVGGKMAGWSCLLAGATSKSWGNVTVFRGLVGSQCSAPRIGRGTLAPQPLSLRSPASGLFLSAIS